MTLPSDIESYLTKDEKVIKTGKSREWKEIYVTNKRVILRRGGIFGKEIMEASYRHISSIEFKKPSPLGYIIAGTSFSIFGIWLTIWAILERGHVSPLFKDILSDFFTIGIGLGLVSTGFGIIIIVIGFIVTSAPQFTIHVVGRKPLIISGKLQEIIRIIREYREKVELGTSMVK